MADNAESVLNYSFLMLETVTALSGATGGAASDIFVYTAGVGHDTITNFVAAGTAHDVIEMDHAVFLDWAALLAASSQSGADTIIRADADNSITLKNVAVNTLQSNDFRFV
ncbi:hypothetical protein F4V89_27110 [Neorhizobium galegae]|nr:hypothetical protein F4V89_27110 [Neorhizobium galegae]